MSDSDLCKAFLCCLAAAQVSNSTVLEQITLYTYAVSYNGDLHQNGYAVAIVAALVQALFFTSHLAGFDLLVVTCLSSVDLQIIAC